MEEVGFDLVRRILEGDKNAFEHIVYDYQGLVYRICLRFMKNKEDAEDVCQEVFILIYKRLNTFNFNSSLSTWIYSICVNACLNKLKAQGRYKLDYFEINECTPADLNPVELAEAKEERGHILSEINKLSDKPRTIVKLRLFGDKTFNDIGRLLGIPAASARTSFVRSREHLRKVLINLRKE